MEARLRRRNAAPGRDRQELLDGLKRTLTTRELEVLKKMGGGRGAKEIAAELGLSPCTVRSRQGSLMKKLDRPNVTALSALAVHARLGRAGCRS